MTINKTLPVSLSILLSTAAFAADNTAPVIIDASPCLELTRAIERLTCFEDQAKAAQRPAESIPRENLPVVSIPRSTGPQPAPSTQQVQPQPAAETPQPAENASVSTVDSVEANFGLPDNDEKEKNSKRTELISRVAEIKQLNQHRVLITLENGQTWEQMETHRFALEVGDEIRIYPTRWGNSYRLASQSHSGFIQVQRLR